MTSRGKILIVEDNADHLELFTDSFEPDYEIISASTGDECLSLLAREKVELVILDYYLSSHFSGLEILGQITDQYPKVPVIMVTAYGNEDLAVQAMKYGAHDYIRKTLDNSYIDRIHEHAEEIMGRQAPEQQNDVRRMVLNYFEENRDRFIAGWHERMQDLQERVNLPDAEVMTEEEVAHFFTAFLADIQNDRPGETMLFLKKKILLQEADEKSLLSAELLNMSFKEMARIMIRERFPDSFDNRSAVMTHIGSIVDENDLELSKEYERLIVEATERVRESERLATKTALMATLQHELRQPLSVIQNILELAKTGRMDLDENRVDELLGNISRISDLLDRLERDSHMHTKRYGDNLDTFDVE